MEHGDFAFNDKYHEARELLRVAVSNLDYLDYASYEGPLQLSQLAARGRNSMAVQELTAEVGWPNLIEDTIIEPVKSFSVDKDFVDSLTVRGDGHERMKLISSYFFRLLLVSPHDTSSAESIGMNVIAEMPMLERAYAIAPDLFENLRIILEEFKKRYRELRPLEEDHLYAAIMAAENIEVPQAMHMAYRILGRLIKVSDSEILRKRLGREEPAAPILSADAILQHGGM